MSADYTQEQQHFTGHGFLGLVKCNLPHKEASSTLNVHHPMPLKDTHGWKN
jgi:hypothetical protein